MSFHPARSDPAPGAMPARDQSRDIPTLERDEINREQQDSGGMPRPSHAQANRALESRCPIRIGNESHRMTGETQRVPNCTTRDDDDDAGSCPERQQSANRAMQD